MGTQNNLVELFRTKAELVGASVAEVKSLNEAYDYVVDLCDKKEACQLLISGCGEGLSKPAEDLCEAKLDKVIAAPGMKKGEFKKLKAKCDEKGFALLEGGIRQHLAGIDIGFTVVEHGIAETGTIVLESSSEETRLATMISEVHVAVLPRSAIVENSYDVEEALRRSMQSHPNYTAFITGPSRTADIERVLAIGVHGPLELHILILED